MLRLIPLALSLVLLTVLGEPAARAQGQPVQVRLATGAFLYDEDLSLLELYLSFGARSLSYIPQEGGGALARVPVRVQVQAATAGVQSGTRPAPVVDEALELQFVVQDPALLLDGQVFVEQVRTAVPPGEYEVTVTLTGPEGATWTSFDLVSDVAVPAYGRVQSPAISSIQLATRIEPAASADSPYAKSGLEVVPNPDAFYGGALSTVPYYAEVYQPAAEGGTYTLLSYLSESNQPVPVEGTQRRVERANRPVDVVVGQIDVAALPSGAYFLRLVALNDANEAVAEQSRRLFVINPDVQRPGDAVAELDEEATLYAVMGEEELDLNLRHARVLASARELQRIPALATDDEKRDFLASFWRQRRSDTRTAGNDARRQFYERLAVANAQYGHQGQAGFETDRGRVFLKYGPPTEVDRRFVEADTLPHEIWIYDNIPGEGRSTFVFADRFRTTRLELIHSDVTGEVSLPNWIYTLRAN